MSYKHFAVATVLVLLAVPAIVLGDIQPKPCDLVSVEGNKCLIAQVAEANGVDVETALAIAKCESGYRHFDEVKGGVLKGRFNSHDTGIFQVNTDSHLKRAKSLGYDIFDKQDNITYSIKEVMARPDQGGFSPWTCWKG